MLIARTPTFISLFCIANESARLIVVVAFLADMTVAVSVAMAGVFFFSGCASGAELSGLGRASPVLTSVVAPATAYDSSIVASQGRRGTNTAGRH